MILGTDPEVIYPVKKPRFMYEVIVGKIEYYQKWFSSLPDEEKRGEQGKEIRKKIRMYDTAINNHFQ